jgi:hypothetical protein
LLSGFNTARMGDQRETLAKGAAAPRLDSSPT